MRISCYLPRANCTNSSIDVSHNAGLRTATFCQSSHRFHLVNSSIFVTHVFGLLPTLFARGCHSNARFAPRLGGRFAIVRNVARNKHKKSWHDNGLGATGWILDYKINVWPKKLAVETGKCKNNLCLGTSQ